VLEHPRRPSRFTWRDRDAVVVHERFWGSGRSEIKPYEICSRVRRFLRSRAWIRRTIEKRESREVGGRESGVGGRRLSSTTPTIRNPTPAFIASVSPARPAIAFIQPTGALARSDHRYGPDLYIRSRLRAARDAVIARAPVSIAAARRTYLLAIGSQVRSGTADGVL